MEVEAHGGGVLLHAAAGWRGWEAPACINEAALWRSNMAYKCQAAKVLQLLCDGEGASSNFCGDLE